MSGTARVIYFIAPKEIELREEKLPALSGGERLFYSTLQAISPGTERLMYRGEFPQGLTAEPGIDGFDGSFEYPFRYGYINVCRDEEENRYFAFKDHCSAFTANPEDLIPLPGWLDDRAALLLPHTETALSIIHDLNPHLGSRILVVGAGVLGSLTALILTRCHGCSVVIADVHSGKKAWFGESGKRLFSADFISAGEGWTEELRRTRGAFDAAVDCSGSADGLQACIDSVAMEGTIIAASWFGDILVGLNLGRDFHRKRLKLVSSQVSTLGAAMPFLWTKKRRIRLAMEIIADLSPLFLISHTFSFSRAPEAYTLIGTTRSSFGLVALEIPDNGLNKKQGG
jgi:threonine dehydrogenase-like Zn-dependent dehydrogenase